MNHVNLNKSFMTVRISILLPDLTDGQVLLVWLQLIMTVGAYVPGVDLTATCANFPFPAVWIQNTHCSYFYTITIEYFLNLYLLVLIHYEEHLFHSLSFNSISPWVLSSGYMCAGFVLTQLQSIVPQELGSWPFIPVIMTVTMLQLGLKMLETPRSFVHWVLQRKAIKTLQCKQERDETIVSYHFISYYHVRYHS